MFSYSIMQWLFIFYFYCFFGWCFESAYVSLKKRKWVNRGFMKGPFLPLYGSGAVMMLVVSRPFLNHWWAVYIAGCIGATVLEYITGVVMEALFKVRYWDYSNQPFNFQGHICLGSSLAWGGLTLFMNYGIHRPIEAFVLAIPSNILTILTILLTIYIVGDFVLSFKAALDLRDILVRMEKVKEEFLRVQKRLDVMIAVAGEEWDQKKDDIKDALTESIGRTKDAFSDKLKVDDLKEGIETRLSALKEMLKKRTEDIPENAKEEIMDLNAEYKMNAASHERLGSLRSLNRRIRNNPTMSSKKYREALDELKKRASEKWR